MLCQVRKNKLVIQAVSVLTIVVAGSFGYADENTTNPNDPLAQINAYCKTELGEQLEGKSNVPALYTEVRLANGEVLRKPIDPKKGEQLSKVADLLFNLDATVTHEEGRRALQTLGATIFKNPVTVRAADSMLNVPVAQLQKASADGKELGDTLLTLADEIEDMNNVTKWLSGKGARKALRRVPIVGQSMSTSIAKMQKISTNLDNTKKSIETKRDEVAKHTEYFARDAINYRNDLLVVSQQIDEHRIIKAQIEEKLKALSPEDPRRRKIEDVVLFPMSQRISDLLQLSTVYQQGILASEVLVRSGHEENRQANRAIEISLPALQIGTKLEIGLSTQEQLMKVYDKVNAVTNAQMVRTADRLEAHNKEVLARSILGVITPETLQHVHEKMRGIVEETKAFKREQLPRIDEAINTYVVFRDQLQTLVDEMSDENQILPLAHGSKTRSLPPGK